MQWPRRQWGALVRSGPFFPGAQVARLLLRQGVDRHPQGGELEARELLIDSPGDRVHGRPELVCILRQPRDGQGLIGEAQVDDRGFDLVPKPDRGTGLGRPRWLSPGAASSEVVAEGPPDDRQEIGVVVPADGHALGRLLQGRIAYECEGRAE